MSMISKILFVCLLVTFGCGAYFAVKSYRVGNKNEALTAELDSKSAELAMLRVNAELTEEAYQALLESETEINDKYEPVIKRVYIAPKGDNAPLAPVLKQALEGL